MKYSEVKKLVRKKSQVKLEEFTYTTIYSHMDGSRCEFENSFIEQFDEYVAIYTEHHGYFIYHWTDLATLVTLNTVTKEIVDYKDRIYYYDSLPPEVSQLTN